MALLEKDYFESLVAEQVPWAVVFAYYPPEGLVFETIKIEHKKLWRQQKRALTINSQVNLTQAFGLWRDGDEYKARKRVFFVFQMTIFATQLVATGGIFDWWEEANSLRPILFDEKLTKWDDFVKVWRPIYDFLVERFIELRNAYRIYEAEFITASLHHKTHPDLEHIKAQIQRVYESVLDLNQCLELETWKRGSTKPFLAKPALTHQLSSASSSTTLPPGNESSSASFTPDSSTLLSETPLFPSYAHCGLPLTTLYIRALGLESMERDLAIIVKRHPAIPNLIHLSRTPLLTPVDSIVAAECHGLVLDELDDYAPVAFSHHLEYQVFDEGPVHLTPHTPMVVTKHLDAPLIELYYYGGEWRVATLETPDGSEKSFSVAIALQADLATLPSFASLFWKVWRSPDYHLDLEAFDKSCSYAFWLLHPEARLTLLHEREALVFEGCTRWTASGGLVDVAWEDMPFLHRLERIEETIQFGTSTDAVIANLASREWNGDATTNVWGAQPLGNPLDLAAGGFKILIGKSRFARLFVPCAFLLRAKEIRQLAGDFIMQELEVLRLLVEQGDLRSAWICPVPEAITTFNLVAPPLQALLAMLDEILPTIGQMTQEEVRKEAEKKKAEGHFLFLLKSLAPTPPSAFHFLKYANPRRMRKYLANWWSKEHSKAPPRTTTQPSYKGGHTIK